MHSRRASGFSMVELVITIAIVAILVALAFPSFEGSMRSNRVTTATNEMIASLSLARMEALRNPGGAGICASSDGATCGDDWDAGWMVWIDVDGNGAPGGTNDRVLRFTQGKRRTVVTVDSPDDAILFDNRGRADAAREITIEPDECPSGQQLIREIGVALTGQARTTREACGA